MSDVGIAAEQWSIPEHPLTDWQKILPKLADRQDEHGFENNYRTKHLNYRIYRTFSKENKGQIPSSLKYGTTSQNIGFMGCCRHPAECLHLSGTQQYVAL